MLKLVKLSTRHLPVTGQHNNVFSEINVLSEQVNIFWVKKIKIYSAIYLCTFRITEKEIQQY